MLRGVRGFRIAAMERAATSLLAAANEFAGSLAQHGGKYPRTKLAIEGLRAALSEEFDVDLPNKFRKRQRKSDAEARLQRQLTYQTKQRKLAEEKLAAASGKSSGLLQVELFTKVGLSDPSLNTRQVRTTMRQHGCSVSHAYIGRIRFAFADLIKDAFREKVKAEVGTLVADGVMGPVFVLHVHDEATMRFRSYSEDDLGASAPGGSRARFSKIQNNALTVQVGCDASPTEWMTELQPLARKDATTLATAIAQAVQPVMQAVGGVLASISNSRSSSSGSPQSIRVLHLLVGDGINTNECAAKKLLHHLHRHAESVAYRLLVWRCASHQANLVVVVAIAGRLGGNPLDDSPLCATLSRLFKHLIPAYHDLFAAQLRAEVARSFRLVHDVNSPETKQLQERSRRLAALYGPAVLPDEVLQIRNRSLSAMEHVSQPGTDPVPLQQRMYDLLRRLVLVSEERPVVTRFFLFTPCCFSLLRMKLLGVPSSIFTSGVLAVENESSKRIAAVKAFYDGAGTPQLLKKACLCLRLTLYATSLTAQTNSSSKREPVMVRLGRGEIQARTSELFVQIVRDLDNDPELNRSDTLSGLLITQAHICIRFDQYKRYPTRLWRLTMKFNPGSFSAEILLFLHTDDQVMDGGYSKLLKQEAWARAGGVEADAAGYLMSPGVQSEITGMLEAAAGSSLEVERKHNQDKRSETVKISSCGTASRNSIIRRYLVHRARQVDTMDTTRRKHEAALRLNVRALAVRANPDLFPRARGRLRWETEVSMEEQSAITHMGDSEALDRYIADHREELEAELARVRRSARLRQEASSAVPWSDDDWHKFLDENDTKFRSLLRSASDRRRASSQKVRASVDMEESARVYPALSPSSGHCPKFAYLGAGLFCFVPDLMSRFVCYVATIGYTVFGLPLSSTALGNQFDLRFEAPFHEAMKPLPELLALWGISDVAQCVVHSLDWTIQGIESDRVVLRITGAERVRKPSGVPGAAAAPDLVEAEVELAFDKIGLLEEEEQDLASVCSSDESGASSSSGVSEDEDDEVGSSEDDDEVPAAVRKPAGTHVYYTNGYFTFIDNAGYNDIKCVCLPRWCGKNHLGGKNRSKTVTPETFGDSRAAPTRARLVLRAWMLWKVNAGGFANKRASRRRVFEYERDRLMADIIALSSAAQPSTGNAAADKLIRQWAPQVMVPKK